MPTQRDKIWYAAMQQMEFSRSFSAEDIQDSIQVSSPAVRTIRNTLDAMVTLGLLKSDGGSGRAPKRYYPVTPTEDIDPGGYTPRKSNQLSPFPWAGSKSHLTDWILDIMPVHDTYVEALGGAGGIIYNKPRSKYEVYNDSDSDLVQFFEVVRENPDELAEWLISVPYSREIYNLWVDEYYSGQRPDDPIERAGRFFSLRYMQYLGSSTGPNGFKTRARRSPARTFDNARKRIDQLASRFDQVIIENQDYRDILEKYDDSSPRVLYYLDPPYTGTPEHNGIEFDHSDLVESLKDVKNDWMVSLSEVPDGLKEYWTDSRASRHKMKRSSGETEEFLICNFDPENREKFRIAINE